MDWLTFISSIFSVAIWPSVILWFFLTHGSQIRDFLGRLIKIGPSGAEAVAPQQATSNTLDLKNLAVSESIEGSSTSNSLIKIDSDPVIEQIKQNIRNNLKEKSIDKPSLEQQKELMIDEYAQLSLRAHFDIIRFNIFGTQIAALRYLIGAKSPQKEENLIPFFHDHLSKIKDRDISDNIKFKQWFEYLLAMDLASKLSDGKYTATAIGKKFIIEFAPLRNVNEGTRIL